MRLSFLRRYSLTRNTDEDEIGWVAGFISRVGRARRLLMISARGARRALSSRSFDCLSGGWFVIAGGGRRGGGALPFGLLVVAHAFPF